MAVCALSPARLARFIEAIQAAGYTGDIHEDQATRTVFSTDNSIYQLLPAAVLQPRSGEDIAIIARIASSAEIGPIPLAPRGGGTGTNGQSLSEAVIVDTSRHMNAITGFDSEAMTVTVLPGVVLDQLNTFLEPHGMFFPPHVSTSSRATIGGMVATDASGKGSRIYGKTSDYIESLDVVLANGDALNVSKWSESELRAACAGHDRANLATSEVARVVEQHDTLINAVFPKMNRGLTGYNLKNVTGHDGSFSLVPLFAGSEGTLAITERIVLRVIKQPTDRLLVVVRYADFDVALRQVRLLIESDPEAIEILDDRIIELARSDPLWFGVQQALGDHDESVAALSFIEFVGADRDATSAKVGSLSAIFKRDANKAVIDWTVIVDPVVASSLWHLRAKAVGLLGRFGGQRQGVAFVEDTAVPPENLADYVAEFRALLDAHGLQYGMFGHADVGCLHVRPALNMLNVDDAALIRPISDDVAALTKKYGGLLWGEHGRGFRGEFSPLFFGPELYEELCRIKAAFDPLNILNPGKLAVPSGSGERLDRIDGVPLRGDADRQVDAQIAAKFDRAMACNGNGACFNWDKDDPMCPSYKVTRDRVQSPKGRAALLREWARLLSISTDVGVVHAAEDALKATLSTCLSCKACSNQCPVQVDIPALKAKFLQHYHRRVTRPIRDHLLRHMETLVAIACLMRWAANAILSFRHASELMAETFGLVDLPKLSRASTTGKLGACRFWNAAAINCLSPKEKELSVVLMEDAFTSSFDTSVPASAYRLLEALGYKVFLARPVRNGKALHTLGMLDEFLPIASRNRRRFNALRRGDVAIVGVEAVTNLMFASEYPRADDGSPMEVLGLEQFLAREINAGRILQRQLGDARQFRLMSHCTEKTARPQSVTEWKHVFAHFGLDLTAVSTGCCGMAGLFGHEAEHREMSQRLYEMSWGEELSRSSHRIPVATGFSCRCQSKRFGRTKLLHPAQVLAQALNLTIYESPRLYPIHG